MKKVMLVILSIMLMLPIGVMAKKDTTPYAKYNTKDLVDTLEEEAIEKEFSDYEESKDKINIYMFRGTGCGYCKKFLNFLNSITDEYGKYFNLVSFEVWQDSDNQELMTEVANVMGQEATGVPYIVIGDKVFPGYAEEYDEPIKEAIVNLYETKKEDRYDVISKVTNKKNHDVVVAIASIVIIGGIIGVAVVTRKNNI